MTERYFEVIVKVRAEEGITPELAQRSVAEAIDEQIDAGRAKVSYASVAVRPCLPVPPVPDGENWIDWHGGLCPVPDQYVKFQCRDEWVGSEWAAKLGPYFLTNEDWWSHDPTLCPPDDQIVRYRVIERP